MGNFLGSDFTVKASKGHVRDLLAELAKHREPDALLEVVMEVLLKLKR